MNIIQLTMTIDQSSLWMTKKLITIGTMMLWHRHHNLQDHHPLVSSSCCKFLNENWFRFNVYISDSFWSIMNECEICFRRTDSFVVKVRMTPSDYNSLFFSPNWCLKFIQNDFALIRTKFSFRLNQFNSVKSFRMTPCHSPFSPNDSVRLCAQSEWFCHAFKRTGFRMIWKQISHSHGITRNHFHSEWVRNFHHGM